MSITLASLQLVITVEYGKSTAPIACPLKPEVGLHWLAVNGSQPLTAENPSVVIAEAEQQPLSLPKELQVRNIVQFLLLYCVLYVFADLLP